MLLSLYGCEEVDSLSDAAEVERFAIDDIQPASITLADPVLTTKDDGSGLITLPVLFGKHDFPMHLRASVTLSKDAVKILQLDFAEDLVFTTLDDKFRFYVVAASGRVKQWEIVLQEIILDEQTQINRFDVLSCTPPTAVVGAQALLKNISSEVLVLGIPGRLPTALVPAIEVAEKSTIEGYTSGQALTFATPATPLPLTVKAESGKTQTWTVHLTECVDVHTVPELSPVIKNRMNLPDDFSVALSDGMTLKSLSTDFDLGVIEIKALGQAFPVTVTTGALSGDDTQTAGHMAGTPFIFTRFDDEAFFYTIDNASQHFIKWTVRFAEWKNTEADITQFVVTQSTPPEVVLKSPVDIAPAQGVVNITFTAGIANFPLTITPEITLSDGASFKEPLPPTFVFNTPADERTLTVVAENGTEKRWTLKIIDGIVRSTETAVLSYTVTEYSSEKNPDTGSSVTLQTTAVIDPVERTVSLPITNWKKYFPLKLRATMEVSLGATVTTSGFGANDELTFATWDETKTFVVRAEDPAHSAIWTLRFIDSEPPKSAEANVTGFTVGANISTGSAVETLYIEPQKKQITLLLSSVAAPISINPTISVSTGALLLDVASGSEIAFDAISTEKTFRVLSQDETTTTWKIVLIHAPQLTNWTLDTWTSSTVTQGWATPNPTGVTVTTQATPGFGGTGSAADLTSKTTTIALVIKVNASGSLFLGEFKYNISNASKPKLMTWFGIPWQGRPIALEADYTYQRGSQLKDKNHNNVTGDDYGSATVELLHWDGTGTFEYHTIKPSDGYGTVPANITVTARGINERIDNAASWSKLRLPLTTLDASKVPTHLHVTFASSYQGDLQICANGSKLKLDNIRLIYYEPETGAIESR
jgi:hypothetical protein